MGGKGSSHVMLAEVVKGQSLMSDERACLSTVLKNGMMGSRNRYLNNNMEVSRVTRLSA